MNSLVKELIRPLLEDNQKVTAIYGGGFKPPIKGHFNLVKQSLKDFPEVDQFIVNVGSGVRNGISQEQAMEIWDVYQEVLGPKVHIQPSPSGQPIKDVRRYAKDHPEELVYFIIGYREGREDDIQDIAARTKGVEEKYPNLKVKVISTSDPEVSGTNARKAASKGDKEKFMTYLPDEIPDSEKEEIYNIVDKAILKEYSLNESTLPDTISPFEEDKGKIAGLEDFFISVPKQKITSFPSDKGMYFWKGSIYWKQAGFIFKPQEYGNGQLFLADISDNDVSPMWFDEPKDNLQQSRGMGVISGEKLKELSDKVYIYQYNPETRVYEKTNDKISSLIREDLVNELDNKGVKYWALYADVFSELLKASQVNKLKEKFNELAQKYAGEKSDALEYFAFNYFDSEGKTTLQEHMAHSNTTDIISKCENLTNHMRKKGYNIDPTPSLKIIDSDVDNSQNFFGTTAYYDPNEQLIVLYTQGRHPKDIVRSYAHEMIHHIQNLEDRLGSITTTNTTEDDHLDSIEREAYEEGNIAFRNWTDSLNKNLNEIGDSSVEPYEWKLQYNGEDSVRYTFFTGYPKIPDNQYEVTYMQTLGEPGNWFGAFRKVEGRYTDVTNEGNIFKIMSTVLKTFKDFLEKRKPLSIEFDPTKNDKDATGSNRRAKLYASYIGKSLPSDYTYTTAADDSILVYQKDYFPKDFGQVLREKKSKDPFGLKAYAYELARLDEGYKVKVYNKHDKKDFFFLSDKNPFKPLEFNSGEEAREAIETQFDLKGKPHKLFDFYIVDNNNKEFPYPSPLRIVREEDTPQLTGKPTIFCDMDGVLVDFDKGYKNLTGMSTQHVNAQGKKDFWKAFRQGLVNKDISEESYWANLDWQPGGKELWDYISKYNPYVLTAPAVNFDFPEELRYSREHNESIKGKLDWVQRLPNMRKIYFAAAKNKAKFAGPNKILIDDRQDTIDAWNANGGIGILYKSSQQVIKDLEKLGL